MNSPFYTEFVNYEKTFDSIDKEHLLEYMEHYRLSQTIFSRIPQMIINLDLLESMEHYRIP